MINCIYEVHLEITLLILHTVGNRGWEYADINYILPGMVIKHIAGKMNYKLPDELIFVSLADGNPALLFIWHVRHLIKKQNAFINVFI
jgi:hypothetical protein